jgi:CRP-like cAMP-binding protein
VVLERRDVLSFFAQHPDAWVRLIEVLCERLRTADQQMAEFALLSVPMRLAKALLRLATPDGHGLNGHATARVHLTQRELGNVIGARVPSHRRPPDRHHQSGGGGKPGRAKRLTGGARPQLSAKTSFSPGTSLLLGRCELLHMLPGAGMKRNWEAPGS